MKIINKSQFFYELPQELIAQTPITPRDSSRLLFYNKDTKNVEHLVFRDILDLFQKGDMLVVNKTRVIPARLSARDNKGREFEVLLLKRRDYTRWEALLKPARKVKIGESLIINNQLSLVVEKIEDDGIRIVNFTFEGVFEDILDRAGSMPLPPYITEKLTEKERYQTVYAKVDGSAAAPTAGLHFTPQLLSALEKKGVEIVEILLQVGLGTFRPVKVDNILEHQMHSEHYEITKEGAETINLAKKEGRRIIAVGTTTVRTLESAFKNGKVEKGEGETDIFIYPPYEFKVVDGLITNFHLPESTLIMLVSALIGREKTLELYDLAVREKYRFFSFGDAMLIL